MRMYLWSKQTCQFAPSVVCRARFVGFRMILSFFRHIHVAITEIIPWKCANFRWCAAFSSVHGRLSAYLSAFKLSSKHVKSTCIYKYGRARNFFIIFSPSTKHFQIHLIISGHSGIVKSEKSAPYYQTATVFALYMTRELSAATPRYKLCVRIVSALN